jgi:thiol-disulfide isomerase/thioredoxin
MLKLSRNDSDDFASIWRASTRRDLRRARRWACILAAVAVFAAGGCSREKASPPDVPTPVHVRPVDLEGYRQVLRSHRDRVVLVDFWATWCAPCIASFPKLVRLHEEFGPRGLAVVSVSVDDPQEKDGPVREFLQEQNAAFDTLILDVEVIDDFMAAVSESWMGQVPAVFLYDRDGALRAMFFGADAMEEVERAVRAMLDETPPGRGVAADGLDRGR